MHPTKFLGCNPWTLPFPIPAGAPGPAGLQSARSRAGPAGQSSVFCPLDFQRTLGSLEKPRDSEISQQRGGAVKALTPKARPFCDRQVGELRECANRRRNTWFPAYLWSAALHCTHGMAILGDPGADEMGVPSRSCTPESAIGTVPPW